MKEKEHIKIWRFGDAPEMLRGLSQAGGDEDWLALIPPRYINEYIPFLEGSSFGCCSVDEYYIHEGYYEGHKVLIGTHA